MKTDYIDVGFIHCLDEEGDLSAYEKHGALQYILDMMMFSINPMYDFGQGDYAIGSSQERQNLYRRCEKEGVGISVMKPFNAGQLLDAKKSPFHQALTTAQCLQYALDKPGVDSSFYFVIMNAIGIWLYQIPKGKIYKNEERKLCETPNVRHYN